MISEQAQKKRIELAKKYQYENPSIYKSAGITAYEHGFDQGYQFAKSEAAAEIKEEIKRLDQCYINQYQYSKFYHAKAIEQTKKIQTLEAIIQKLEDGLNVSANQLLGCSLAIKEHGQNINPEFFVSHYKKFSDDARSTLQNVQAMKEKLK